MTGQLDLLTLIREKEAEEDVVLDTMGGMESSPVAAVARPVVQLTELPGESFEDIFLEEHERL